MHTFLHSIYIYSDMHDPTLQRTWNLVPVNCWHIATLIHIFAVVYFVDFWHQAVFTTVRPSKETLLVERLMQHYAFTIIYETRNTRCESCVWVVHTCHKEPIKNVLKRYIYSLYCVNLNGRKECKKKGRAMSLCHRILHWCWTLMQALLKPLGKHTKTQCIYVISHSMKKQLYKMKKKNRDLFKCGR